MDILWVRFAKDSSLPARMDDKARQRFEALFDMSVKNSAWRIALDLMGLKPAKTPVPMIKWVGNAPYINWNETVRTISNGAMSPALSGQSFIYKTRRGPFNVWKLVRAQWHISNYVLSRTEKGWKPPAELIMQIAESTALGLALLSVTMRLPRQISQNMAQNLAKPAGLSVPHRQALLQMQQLQFLRNELRIAWTILFPDSQPGAAHDAGPDFFWNKAPALPTEEHEQVQNATAWKGAGIAGTQATGRAMLIATPDDFAAAANTPHPAVLIFPLARPETTELFGKGVAVLFGNGGALSHACTIAREHNVTCITGLGNGFIARIRQLLAEKKEVWLDVDPATSTVTLVNKT